MSAPIFVAQKMGSRLGIGALLLRALPSPSKKHRSGLRQESQLMTLVIYWFRQDLRLHDNPALVAALAEASYLLPIYCYPTSTLSAHRKQLLAQALAGLSNALQALNSTLTVLSGDAVSALLATAQQLGWPAIPIQVMSEEIAAPDEQTQVAQLRAAGLSVQTHWQSTLFNLADLPFAVADLPDVFSSFRRRVEQAQTLPSSPLAAPTQLKPLPPQALVSSDSVAPTPINAHPASSFPYHLAAFSGSERAALAHVQQYFSSDAPQHYKQTRNQLMGTAYSTKFSPWLALGALSPRVIYAALKVHEQTMGANDSTYWIFFELLWRDYFRCLHLKYGVRLYSAGGLAETAPICMAHEDSFQRWCTGNTGEALVDAGMRELAATGYLSNRLRQVVASYWLHDMRGDYRHGAAWFESQLLDYDVYSNQGNWLYLAGLGTDPRGGRRFNPEKQIREHDADGRYRACWLSA